MEIQDPDIDDSAFQKILRFHETIFGDGHLEWCLRSLKFMVYDLKTRRSTDDTLSNTDVLDQFFFSAKRFQIVPMAIPPRQALSEKRGPGLFVALLYCHLASALGLRAKILNWPNHHYIRRNCTEGTVYVDLDQNGKILSEDEILALLNTNKQEHRLLTPDEASLRYLRILVSTLKEAQCDEPLHRTLDLLIEAEPQNNRWLAERAMIRKKMGLLKDALQDLKRYFSFVEKQSATPDLVDAYNELQSRI